MILLKKKRIVKIMTVFYTVFLFLAATICFSQQKEEHFTHQFIYTLDYKMDSTNLEKIDTEVMELLINDSISIFQAFNKGLRDSMERSEKAKDPNFDLYDKTIQLPDRYKINYTIIGRGNEYFVSDHFTDAVNLFGDQRDNVIRFYRDHVVLDWKLTEEVESSAGINLQKATVHYGGRNWIAWFSPDYPFSSGPYTFHGLPGLIVELYDEEAHWHFSLSEVRHTDRKILLKSDEYISTRMTNKEQYFKDRLDYIKNATGYDLLARRVILVGEEARAKSIERDKKRSRELNNWIEINPEQP